MALGWPRLTRWKPATLGHQAPSSDIWARSQAPRFSLVDLRHSGHRLAPSLKSFTVSIPRFQYSLKSPVAQHFSVSRAGASSFILAICVVGLRRSVTWRRRDSHSACHRSPQLRRATRGLACEEACKLFVVRSTTKTPLASIRGSGVPLDAFVSVRSGTRCSRILPSETGFRAKSDLCEPSKHPRPCQLYKARWACATPSLLRAGHWVKLDVD